ncbi:hypothetical protein ACFQ3S_09080 [Mucilaginibacter terrae]|uniref:hypothetical protein n=1 Tax=Mucilaginibacter terrae TaxID=1955052 RepID=UPI003635DD89
MMQASFIHRKKPDNPLRDLVISQNINSYLEVVSSNIEPDADLSREEVIYHACFGPKDDMLVLHFVLRSVMKETAIMQWTNEAIQEAIASYAALNGLVELMMVHKQPFENIYQSADSLLKETPKGAGFLIEELDF